MSTKYTVTVTAETVDTDLLEIYMSGKQEGMDELSTGELLAELMARNCGSACVSVSEDAGRESSYARFGIEF